MFVLPLAPPCTHDRVTLVVPPAERTPSCCSVPGPVLPQTIEFASVVVPPVL